MSKIYKSTGDELWKKAEKISSELVTLTYGALIAALLKETEGSGAANGQTMDLVNSRLEKMGVNMGVRMVEDFFAKANLTKCTNFRDTIEMLSKVAFKMYLGFSPLVEHWSVDGNACSLLIERSSNFLTDFVELEQDGPQRDLVYCQLLCGCIKGALEVLQLPVDCEITRDYLRPHTLGSSGPMDILEIRVSCARKRTEALVID